MVAALKVPDFMTIVKFLAWDAPSGPAWQLIEGVPQAMAPASGTHAVMQNEVGRLIGNHLAATVRDAGRWPTRALSSGWRPRTTSASPTSA